MSPRKRERDRINYKEPDSPRLSDAVDEWAPADNEEGLSLSQALRGSQPRTKRRQSTKPLTDKLLPKRPKTDAYIDIKPHEHHPTAIVDGNQHDGQVGQTLQQMAIADMFTDSEAETGAAAEDKDICIAPSADGSNVTATMEQENEPTGGMDFMDKESADNYQRLLSRHRQAKQRAAEKAARRQSLRGQTPQPVSSEAVSPVPIKQSPIAKHVAFDSTNDLPENPLDLSDTSTRGTRRRSETRQTQIKYQISDSDGSEDEVSDVLDHRAIIGQRLRTRQAVSSVRSRFEQARRDVYRRVYESDSDATSELADPGVEIIGSHGETEQMANDPIDMPETDSEPERTKQSAVLVIRDSSDDDDFTSDPDDLPTLPLIKPTPRPPNAKMNAFLSAFEPQRQKQMKRKLQQRTTTDTVHPRGLSEPKTVQGYSDELDDDLADFIVDDDVDNEIIAHTHVSPSMAENKDRSESDDSARPTFGMDRPHGALSLMPEEFSQLDLQTSFKTYVQYLVYWICNNREKPRLSDDIARYFYLGYITVARVIDSVEQSVVASSVWLTDFRTDLYRYPEYSAIHITAVPGCEACHFRKNRTATFCVTLSGTPYKRTTLAPPQTENEIDEIEETEASTSDALCVDSGEGGVLSVPAYNVGRTCKQRSSVCHNLHHYFHHLSDDVEAALELLLEDGKSNSTNEPDDIEPGDMVAKLETRGTIDKLYDEFQSLVDSAKSEFTS
ncbi:hypothetical protein GGH19_004111 [Coemansia sp. RSA 1807]|nr:hypothetical protein GGH19_004111 [Coemansia sp. RSA 1807]